MRHTFTARYLHLAPLAVTLSLGLGLGVALSQLAPSWALTPQSREYYLKAQQSERRGLLKDAETNLRQAIAMDPKDYLNYVKLASILNQEDRPNEAISYYQQALNLQPEDPMILFSLGGVYEQVGQYAKAEEAYALCAQNNPTYQFTLLNLARAEIQQKKYKPAIVHYQQFLNRYPDHYEARRRLARLYLVTGQETAAVQEYDILKQRFPKRFDEHLDLARALNGANAPAQALEELKVAYAKEGGKADIDEEMGRAHVALGQADMAILNYQKAYALDPHRDDLLLKVGDLYRIQKDPDKAIENYQAYLKLHPANQDVRRFLVNTYLDNHRYEPALNELGVMLDATTDPQKQYEIEKDMAYTTQMLGDMPKAIQQYEALLQQPQAAKDLQLKSNLAIAYHREGAFERAIPLYKDIYTADSQLKQQYQIDTAGLGNDLAVALTAIGDKAYKATDFNAALTAYGDAASYAAKTNYWPQLGLGNTYYSLNMPDKAYEAYGEVLAKDPSNVTAKLYRTRLAIAKAGSTQQPGAQQTPVVTSEQLATLEGLAKEHPDNLEVLVSLADAYAQQGNANAAVETYQKALVLDPQNVDLLMSSGAQWQRLGNFAQAKDTYLRAVAVNDKLPVLYYNLGIAYNELGQLDQSAQAYQKAIALDPSYSDSKYGLAITLEKQQKYQDALETYQTYANDPQARYVKEAQDRIEVLKRALNPAPMLPAAVSPTQPARSQVRISIPETPAKTPAKNAGSAHPVQVQKQEIPLQPLPGYAPGPKTSSAR